ncbi:unnamed protein product [Cuscuta epithymum]|uniref:Uncharacterized protein n=1 Tax=Cuscuta epithymum TaxID=186058 RepID=A0AAV0DHJ2_9ASTE|nr:unnamed protein product [Cuscuta epithymum]
MTNGVGLFGVISKRRFEQLGRRVRKYIGNVQKNGPLFSPEFWGPEACASSALHKARACIPDYPAKIRAGSSKCLNNTIQALVPKDIGVGSHESIHDNTTKRKRKKRKKKN